MRALWISLYVCSCVLLATVFVSCFSSQRVAASDTLAQAVSTSMADGFISPQEAEIIQSKLNEVRSAPTFDWVETIGTVVGSVGATLGVLRAIPNQHIIGPQEAKALNKAAGL